MEREHNFRLAKVEQDLAIMKTVTGTEADATGLFGAMKRSFDAIEKLKFVVEESARANSSAITDLTNSINKDKATQSGRLQAMHWLLLFLGGGGGILIYKALGVFLGK